MKRIGNTGRVLKSVGLAIGASLTGCVILNLVFGLLIYQASRGDEFLTSESGFALGMRLFISCGIALMCVPFLSFYFYGRLTGKAAAAQIQ
jgi:hypothetical protein